MLRNIALLIVLTSCASTPPSEFPAANPSPLRYTVRVTQSTADIRAVITSDAESVVFSLPERYAYAMPSEVLIRDLASDSRVERLSPRSFRLWPSKRKTSVSWSVPIEHRDRIAADKPDKYEHPYLAAEHGMLVSGSMFFVPDIKFAHGEVRFESASEWQVHAPWPRSDAGPYLASREALANDIVAVGKWDIDRAGMLTIAYAPGQATLRKLATPLISAIVDRCHHYFGAKIDRPYLVVFGRPDDPGLGGSPKHASMTLSVAPELAVHPAALKKHVGHLIAHEYHHVWANSNLQLPDELRFYNEGFTDYYAHRITQEVGVTTPLEHHDILVKLINGYLMIQSKPGRSLESAGGPGFFKDRDAHNLVYQGGLTVAALLDLIIRARGHATLDDLMRRFNNHGAKAPTLADFIATVASFTDANTANRVQQWVSQKATIDVAGVLKSLGHKVATKTDTPTLDLRANLNKATLLDLDPGGLAFQLGLRPGDTFVEVNGRTVTSPSEVHAAWQQPSRDRLTVAYTREGVSKTLTHKLSGKATLEVRGQPWKP